MDAGGELNIDIRDADKDGIEGTDADRAASEAIMASINRDASTWQVVTRDEHTKVSGELDVQNLRNLQRNLDFVGRYAEVNNTSVPAHIAAEGAQAVDQFREIMLYGGASAAEAAEMMATPRFQVMLRERKSYDAIRDSDVSNDDLLKSIILIKSGEELYRDQNTGALMVRTVCCTEGPCGREISEVRALSTEDVGTFISAKLKDGLPQDLKDALECDLAYALLRGNMSHLDTLATSLKFPKGEIEKYQSAVSEILNKNTLQGAAFAAAGNHLDTTLLLPKLLVDSSSGKVDPHDLRSLIETLNSNPSTVMTLIAVAGELEGCAPELDNIRLKVALDSLRLNKKA